MNIAKQIHNTLSKKPFSYGESLATIQEFNGKSLKLSENLTEDFLLPDNSVIRLTNKAVYVLEMLSE